MIGTDRHEEAQMRPRQLKHTALPAGGDLGSNDGARISGGHADDDGDRPARVDWLTTASLVALGVRWGIWPITDSHRRPFDERGVLCNAARSPRR
jgi:hypothetical protein